MTQKVKRFDAVQLMRRLRDRMSEEMAPMSSQERILYIRRKAAASPLSAAFSDKPQVAGVQSGAREDLRE
jgi:hypothetical protein